MLSAELLVPVTTNAGQPVAAEDWTALRDRLLDTLGGFQEDRMVAGAGRSDLGQDFGEASRVYTVALVSWQQAPAFLALVEWTRRRFGQETMVVEIAGVPEVLGAPPWGARFGSDRLKGLITEVMGQG